MGVRCGGADAARGDGNVGRMLKTLEGDEASWRGHFETIIRKLCVHHKMFVNRY